MWSSQALLYYHFASWLTRIKYNLGSPSEIPPIQNCWRRTNHKIGIPKALRQPPVTISPFNVGTIRFMTDHLLSNHCPCYLLSHGKMPTSVSLWHVPAVLHLSLVLHKGHPAWDHHSTYSYCSWASHWSALPAASAAFSNHRVRQAAPKNMHGHTCGICTSVIPDTDHISIGNASSTKNIHTLHLLVPSNTDGSSAVLDEELDRDDSGHETLHTDPSLTPQVTYDLPISSWENLKCYGDLIKHMACTLDLSIIQPQSTVTNFVFVIV